MTLEEIQSRMALGERVVPPRGTLVRISEVRDGEPYEDIDRVEKRLWDEGELYLELLSWDRFSWNLQRFDTKVVVLDLPEDCPPYETWERY